MAVPKKRRITRRLLNKGAQFLRLYSNITSLSSNRLRFAGVGKTLTSSAYFLSSQTSLAIQISMPGRHKLFDQPVFSLPLPSKVAAPFKKTLNQRFTSINLSWYIAPIRKRGVDLLPYLGDTPLTREYMTFLLKQSFFIMQTPHTWGAQRFYLVRHFPLRPTYLSLFSTVSKLKYVPRAASGLTYPLWSTNLTRPFGPTLKMLWAYTKANPNEGYWIYCMWLNVKKRWRRWLVFPYTYMWKRNIFRRSTILNDIRLNTNIHLHFFVYQRLGIFYRTLILTLPLVKPLRAEGFLTRIAKQLVNVKYFNEK